MTTERRLLQAQQYCYVLAGRAVKRYDDVSISLDMPLCTGYRIFSGKALRREEKPKGKVTGGFALIR